MGKFKKIGIGITGIFILLIAIGMAVPPSEKSTNTQNDSDNISDISNEVQSIPKIYLNSVDDLLPTPIDLGTPWELADKTQFIGHSTDDSSVGLLDKVQQSFNYPKVPGELPYSILVTLYKFDDTENSRNYIVERAGFDHGYNVPKSWNGKLPDTNCYAMVGHMSEEKYANSMISSVGSDPSYNMTCLENNIVFDIKAESRDYKDTVKEFANIINGKI